MNIDTSKPLFVFGTLLDRDVLSIVLGPNRHVELLTAVLSDFRRVRIADETYPVLVADSGAETRGALLMGLNEEDWARIRFFESDEYALDECTVSVTGSGLAEAQYCAESVVAGVSEEWTLSWWQQHHKQRFIDMITSYMAVYTDGGLAEAESLWAELQQDYDLDLGRATSTRSLASKSGPVKVGQ